MTNPIQTKQFQVSRVFNIPVPDNITVQGFAIASEHVPAINSDYVFSKTNLSDLLAWFQVCKNDSLYLFGPTGCGKTSVIQQVAARLNYPVFEVTAHARLETPELIGHPILTKDDGMQFQYGPLALAMKHGGIFLLNEIDLLDSGTAAGLNGVLEGSQLTIPENGGEVIKPNPYFRFVATGNTAGNGDSTGQYQGTLRQNIAFMDRFFAIETDYPAQETEKEILNKAEPGLPADILDRIIKVATAVRK